LSYGVLPWPGVLPEPWEREVVLDGTTAPSAA
jgi:hypothetical protein